MNNLIKPMWPVRSDAPLWKNDDGESFAFCVMAWIDCQVCLGRLPLLSDFAAIAESGDYCGVRVAADGPYGPDFLLTQSAMTACVSELGIDAATPAALHDSLSMLVQTGYLAAEVETHDLPGVGAQMLYHVAASIAEATP